MNAKVQAVPVSSPDLIPVSECAEQVAFEDTQEAPHVIVVGAGPVGIRFVEELMKRKRNVKITLFGDEPWAPYNRVKLSCLLSGDVSLEEIELTLPESQENRILKHYNCRVEKIVREEKVVIDETGVAHSYDHLVLATGSRPFVPNVSGREIQGVFTFRSLGDTASLLARSARSRHCLVVGGGLLGLEAAKALGRSSTRVTVVQQGPFVMNRQLDQDGAHILQKRLAEMGIEVLVGNGVRAIVGDRSVEGVTLRNGELVACDTVVFCAGIKANLELARSAWLKVNQGIVVDDNLRTTDESIFAIGECAEHRGLTYGIVQPGFEQASIAAEVLSGGHATYLGSTSATELKVVGESVFSAGQIEAESRGLAERQIVHKRPRKSSYRKLVLKKGHLVGAIGVGDWSDAPRLKEMVINRKRLLPWQQVRFLLTGNVFPAGDSQDIRTWPDDALICNCRGVTKGELVRVQGQTQCSLAQLKETTGASTVCGSCQPLVASLYGEAGEPVKTPGQYSLLTAAALSLCFVMALVLIGPLPFSQSVQDPWPIDLLWTDGLYKQISGFTLLGLSLLALTVSLRKRIKRIQLWAFSSWRVVHVILGVLMVLTLGMHTGLQSGSNLNQLLMIDFVAVIAAGALASVVIAKESIFGSRFGKTLRSWWTWGHILFMWPFPVLLLVHIVSVYYF
ncbi:NAD(FAD)-dependent dehydrogenase [Oleiphilus messinensis]|uniref:NAD(FAD)-dependent dehydrogenase n=1 Tax=Oleiphilus messinensis TaxID=141451 RepID=A0A1Y0I6N1_9GAMM|nr:FAD-dependent oxidoreductase [Oleiphilus messinensis]ARU55849.1 NAD(FAD)-dependent dehydrogenase [Oleiphilus messinensis]